jgi:hypothetical protein
MAVMICVPPREIWPSSWPRRLDMSPGDGARVVVGRHHLDLHDRLEQHRMRLLGRVLERHRAGDLERHLVRVDVVVAAVPQADLHVHHRVAGHDAAFAGLADALLDRLDELLGMVPPVMSFSKTKPSPGAGNSSILQCPYWPLPPVCLMYLPSAFDVLRTVSL